MITARGDAGDSIRRGGWWRERLRDGVLRLDGRFRPRGGCTQGGQPGGGGCVYPEALGRRGVPVGSPVRRGGARGGRERRGRSGRRRLRASMFNGAGDYGATPGAARLSPAGGFDDFLVKLTSTGGFAFARRFGGAGTTSPTVSRSTAAGTSSPPAPSPAPRTSTPARASRR